MCAHLSGMIMQPCFRVEKIDYRRFRGSISGLGFAYCDFYQHNARAEMISRGPESRTHITRRMRPSAAAPPEPAAPMRAAPIQSAPVVSVQSSPMASPQSPEQQPLPEAAKSR